MPQNFDFSRLIEKYSADFIIEVPRDGDYDKAGIYQEIEPERIVKRGAIISHRESKLFRSDGTLTQQDRALYMLEPLPDALQGAKAIFEGQEYRIGDQLNNARFTGVYNYTLKYVSAFNEVTTDD